MEEPTPCFVFLLAIFCSQAYLFLDNRRKKVRNEDFDIRDISQSAEKEFENDATAEVRTTSAGKIKVENLRVIKRQHRGEPLTATLLAPGLENHAIILPRVGRREDYFGACG